MKEGKRGIELKGKRGLREEKEEKWIQKGEKGRKAGIMQIVGEGDISIVRTCNTSFCGIQDSSSRTRSSSLKGESRPQRARHMTGMLLAPATVLQQRCCFYEPICSSVSTPYFSYSTTLLFL